MKASRSEFELIQTKVKEKPANPLLEQAAVAHEKLTQEPTWNIYLQEVQAQLEVTEQVLEGFKEKLNSPELADPIEVQRIRNWIFIYTDRVGTLKSVIDLPRQIIEQWEKETS